MKTFDYTVTVPVTSTVVEGVFYNDNTKELLVDLEDRLYLYEGVPYKAFEALVRAESVGRAFQELKAKYGPGRFFGEYGYVSYNEVNKESDLAATQQVVDHNTYNVYVSSGIDFTDVNASNSFITSKPAEAPRFELRLPEEVDEVAFKYEVVFVVDGVDGEKTYSVEATDVNGAVDALSEATAALGLDVDVKRATVYFE